jgi:metallophosphoesterase superfamily enzyme
MFHSHANKELELFLKWRSDLAGIQIRLVRGNHDILKDEWYEYAGIDLNSQTLSRKDFHFVHDISDQLKHRNGFIKNISEDRSYFFSGHIHPGIRLNGMGRQSLCFPCFYFGKKYAVLPAFSRFTGIAMIYPETEEEVFAIVNQELIQLQ